MKSRLSLLPALLSVLVLTAGTTRICATDGSQNDLLQYEADVLVMWEDVFPAREKVVIALSIKPFGGRFLVLPKEGKRFVCDKYIIIEEDRHGDGIKQVF